MKKPTMQDIAEAAGVSRVTVWKVLNNHPGVSEVKSSMILNEAAQLGYPLPESFTNNGVQNHPALKSNTVHDSATISVVVSRPDSSVFWSNIIHEIAKEVTKTGCSLMYTYVPTEIPDDYILPPPLTSGQVQGIIILNVYDAKLLSILNRLPIPKVFLDAVTNFSLDTLTGDMLLLEGKSSVEKITDYLFASGRQKIGFIGDINYAMTNKLRYEGYTASIAKHASRMEPAYCKTGTIGIETYVEEIHTYLSGLRKLPDAFVCVSDFVAHVVYQELMLMGIRVPEEVIVTGYDNISDYIDMKDFLTTVNINTSALGKRLISQLFYRIENPDTPVEVIYLYSEILYH